MKSFKGYLHSDGYEVYHKLEPDIVNVGCQEHARRKFYEIIKDKKGGVNQTASKAVGHFTKIANIEYKLATLTAEGCKRLELVKAVFDKLFVWAETAIAAPKSRLDESFTYLKNQKYYFI